MSIFKAEPVVVPSDMAEKFDGVTGQNEGFLRNLIADSGNLHVLEEELLAIGLMTMVKGLMEDKELPDEEKPLSIERLSNVVYVVMFAYCTGAMRVDEEGDVAIGNIMEDIKKFFEVTTSEKIQFANGKTMPTPEFMGKLKILASPESIGDTYKKVVKRKGLTKSITPQAAFSVAKVSILLAKDLTEEGK